MDVDAGPDRTSELDRRREPRELRRIEVERRRELVEGMMRIGLSVRKMVDALLLATPPIEARRSSVGDDVVLIKKRWIERYTGSFDAHVAAIWSTLDALEKAIMAKALDGDIASVREGVRIQDRKARLIGAYQPEKLLLLGPSGGPIQVEHSVSPEAAVAQGIAVMEELLGRPRAALPAPIDVPSTEHSNGNGASSNGHG